jgi:hypothetical protein
MRSFKDEINARVIKQYWFSELSRRLGLDIIDSPVLRKSEDKIVMASEQWITKAITTYNVRGLISEVKFLCDSSTVNLCLWSFRDEDSNVKAVYSALVATYTYARKLIGLNDILDPVLQVGERNKIYELAMKHKFIVLENELVIYSNITDSALTVGMLHKHGGYIDLYRLLSVLMNITEKDVFPLQ